VDILRELKSMYTYKELSEILGIQESLICRYVNGATIPSEIQAIDIVNRLKSKGFLIKFFKDKIKIYDDGYVDTMELLQYPSLLKMLLETYIEEFRGRATKIVTVASHGIPFATLVSMIMNLPLVIAKKYKESIGIPYIEGNLMEGAGIISNLYLRRDIIRKDDSILIVDDLIRTGKTVSALMNMINKRGAELSGILVIVAVGEEWYRRLNNRLVKYIFKL
jgi:adenine/guanine phosphoribosyltransferase-like PRPP-binding protein